MSAFLGIELGSTRIKAVLIDENFKPVASGSYDWENKLVDGVWTYDLKDVWTGLQDSFRKLNNEVKNLTGRPLAQVDAIGISAMMHGYLAFDAADKLLVPFRTWRNTMTEKAAAALTALFGFNIPQRWSVAHLWQAVLNREAHVKDAAFITTLAGYVHWKLTGKKVLGVGDASGMFPIDSATNDYNRRMAEQFDELMGAADNNARVKWKLADLFPKTLSAGENAGSLTAEGAALLDPSGTLKSGVPFCPPEGDAGTGMTATNSVAERTGNVSAGTSIFAMIVLEKALSKVYPEIDLVTTPSGKPVAMAHCNNCTTDLDGWIKLFGETIALSGAKLEKAALYDALYHKALEGDADCGGLVSYNYYSGEHTVRLAEGRPLFVRLPDARFTLANFARNLLYSSMATLKLGMDILTENEKARVDKILGHGGLFKTKGVGQRFMAAALDAPVAVMESAGEGGAWGIALLAAYLVLQSGETLEEFLDKKVFAGNAGTSFAPDAKDVEGFALFIERYKKGLAVERSAVENIK